jgi:hypothetical protein
LTDRPTCIDCIVKFLKPTTLETWQRNKENKFLVTYFISEVFH